MRARVLSAVSSGREEPVCGDFSIGRRHMRLAESEHEQRYVVAARYAAVKEDAIERWELEDLDIALLGKFASKRLDDHLSRLHPAPWQMPTGGVGVHDQEYSPIVVGHQPANPKGHSPRPAPVEVMSPSE